MILIPCKEPEKGFSAAAAIPGVAGLDHAMREYVRASGLGAEHAFPADFLTEGLWDAQRSKHGACTCFRTCRGLLGLTSDPDGEAASPADVLQVVPPDAQRGRRVACICFHTNTRENEVPPCWWIAAPDMNTRRRTNVQNIQGRELFDSACASCCGRYIIARRSTGPSTALAVHNFSAKRALSALVDISDLGCRGSVDPFPGALGAGRASRALSASAGLSAFLVTGDR